MSINGDSKHDYLYKILESGGNGLHGVPALNYVVVVHDKEPDTVNKPEGNVPEVTGKPEPVIHNHAVSHSLYFYMFLFTIFHYLYCLPWHLKLTCINSYLSLVVFP